MPLAPVLTTPIFLSSLASNAFIGISATQLASGLASGLFMYAQTGLKVQSIDVGTLGAGTGIGVGIILAPPILVASLTAAMSSNGILGIMSPFLCNAISIAVSTVLSTAIINTVSPSVGVGTGIATLIPNPAASFTAFDAAFRSAGMNGVQIDLLAHAVAQGIDGALPSGFGPIVIAGSPSIVPSGGSGSGKLI